MRKIMIGIFSLFILTSCVSKKLEEGNEEPLQKKTLQYQTILQFDHEEQYNEYLSENNDLIGKNDIQLVSVESSDAASILLIELSEGMKSLELYEINQAQFEEVDYDIEKYITDNLDHKLFKTIPIQKDQSYVALKVVLPEGIPSYYLWLEDQNNNYYYVIVYNGK